MKYKICKWKQILSNKSHKIFTVILKPNKAENMIILLKKITFRTIISILFKYVVIYSQYKIILIVDSPRNYVRKAFVLSPEGNPINHLSSVFITYICKDDEFSWIALRICSA